MQKLTVPSKYNNKKVSNLLLDTYPGLTLSTIYKALRKKDIRINNIKISENVIIKENDEITIYITDDILFKESFHIEKIYEDDNILIVDKPQKLEVVSSNNAEVTLTSILQEQYKYIKPCHRLDRNTTGLIIFAKNEDTLSILLKKFKNKEIKKEYKCTVYGILEKKAGILKDYLFKDRKKSIVYISSTPKKGYLEIITKYKVLSENKKNNTSVLNIELITGRTHQIRAHLAYIGHPIIGDGKYGKNEINKKFKVNYQQLTAYKITFNFSSPSGKLEYLNSKKISI